MLPVVTYSLHKSFNTLAFLDVDCKVEVVTLLRRDMHGGFSGSKQKASSCSFHVILILGETVHSSGLVYISVSVVQDELLRTTTAHLFSH